MAIRRPASGLVLAKGPGKAEVRGEAEEETSCSISRLHIIPVFVHLYCAHESRPF